MGYLVSVIRGLVHLLAVLPRLVAKPCELGFLFERVGWFLMIRRIRGRSFVMWAAELFVAAETLGGEIVVVARQERAGAAPHPLRPPVNLGGNVVGNSSE